MNKKTGIVFSLLLLVAGVLFFLPNSALDILFQSSAKNANGLKAINDVYGRVEKKGERDTHLSSVAKSSVIASGDTFYTHADSKVLFAFSNSFWLMPHAKMDFLKNETGWIANLVYGDIKKISDISDSQKPNVEVVFASQPISTENFSTYEFDPIDIDMKTEDLKDFSPDSAIPQNVLEKQIFQTLSLHKKFFQGCLVKHYKKTSGNFGSGETVFELTIDITGNISKTQIIRSDIPDDDYKKCLKTVLDRVRFRNLPLKEPMIALFPLSIEMP
ncbi:MAG: hypothetical protein IT287_01915 [Bdellovibrionaceae bacterium]|nr:hypothetical protein [Pseudobdellovibrionaceae bacterium]